MFPEYWNRLHLKGLAEDKFKYSTQLSFKGPKHAPTNVIQARAFPYFNMLDYLLTCSNINTKDICVSGQFNTELCSCSVDDLNLTP